MPTTSKASVGVFVPIPTWPVPLKRTVSTKAVLLPWPKAMSVNAALLWICSRADWMPNPK